MSFTTLGAVHAFDPGALPGPVAAAVWRGVDMVGAVARTVPTGFGALDAQLPGGGWPTQAVTELLLPQALRCEWRLLGPALPALLQEGGRIYLVAPSQPPHAGGLAQLGVPPAQLVWVRAVAPLERLWATEQILQAGPVGAVLAWLPQARPEQIRRLQIHAQSCDAPVFLCRPEGALQQASPAPLRVGVTLGSDWVLQVHIPKRRGSAFEGVLRLEAIPGNLQHMLPPRLGSAAATVQAPLAKELSDVRALGRIAAPATTHRLLAH